MSAKIPDRLLSSLIDIIIETVIVVVVTAPLMIIAGVTNNTTWNIVANFLAAFLIIAYPPFFMSKAKNATIGMQKRRIKITNANQTVEVNFLGCVLRQLPNIFIAVILIFISLNKIFYSDRSVGSAPAFYGTVVSALWILIAVANSLAILVRKDHRSIADLWAGTTIVKDDK